MYWVCGLVRETVCEPVLLNDKVNQYKIREIRKWIEYKYEMKQRNKCARDSKKCTMQLRMQIFAVFRSFYEKLFKSARNFCKKS